MTLSKDELMQINLTLFPRLQKELMKMPSKYMRISLAETLLQYALGDLIYSPPDEGWEKPDIETLKKDLKMHVQLCMMRVIAAIDAYPNLEEAEKFRVKSHEEYRNRS